MVLTWMLAPFDPIDDADADAIHGQNEGKYKTGGSTARLHWTSANVSITQ
jgi:hypothetical protein